MDLFANELLKFRRSHVWSAIVFVPIICVVIGAGNYSANVGQVGEGWNSFFSQVTLFYGLLFMAAGIAILCSASWRFEHRGHNWHTLLTSTRSAGGLVAAKIAAVTVLVAAMQVVVLLATYVAGLVLGVPGNPTLSMALTAVLAVLPGAAVAAWQSLISMVIRNFAAPIAIAFFLCVVSFGLAGAGLTEARFVLPHALVGNTVWLGSNAMNSAGELGVGNALSVFLGSMLLAALGWLTSVIYLQRSDIRIS